MKTIHLTLPYPDRVLSPNSRAHWRRVAEAKKHARATAKLSMLVEGAPRADGVPAITVTFHPPDNRKRDDDNMIASFKAYRDGIADALGMDDNRFRMTYNPTGEKRKGGTVEVDIEYEPLPF